VDSKAWSLNAPWEIKGRPNEATVRVLKDGTMMALVRREAPGMNKGMIGTSPAPFRSWTWNEITVPLGGPNFIELPDGRLIAGSRGLGKTPGAHMVLFQMTANSLTPFLELPSSGDCSYPGLVFHEGHLYVSYYSSPEGQDQHLLGEGEDRLGVHETPHLPHGSRGQPRHRTVGAALESQQSCYRHRAAGRCGVAAFQRVR